MKGENVEKNGDAIVDRRNKAKGRYICEDEENTYM